LIIAGRSEREKYAPRWSLWGVCRESLWDADVA